MVAGLVGPPVQYPCDSFSATERAALSKAMTSDPGFHQMVTSIVIAPPDGNESADLIQFIHERPDAFQRLADISFVAGPYPPHAFGLCLQLINSRNLTRAHLASFYLTAEDAKMLAATLSASKSLTSFEYCRNKLCGSIVAEALRPLSTITHVGIEFGRDYLRGDDLNALLPRPTSLMLAGAPAAELDALARLMVRSRSLSRSSLMLRRRVCDPFESLQPTSGIQELQLVFIDETDLARLTDAFTATRTLHTLRFDGFHRDEALSTSALRDALRSSCVRELSFDCPVNGPIPALSEISSVTSLEVRLSAPTNEQMSELFADLSKPDCRLESVRIWQYTLDEQPPPPPPARIAVAELISVLRANRSLRNFFLSPFNTGKADKLWADADAEIAALIRHEQRLISGWLSADVPLSNAQLLRNLNLWHNWASVCVMLAFIRANRRHPFQFSVFPLLLGIRDLIPERRPIKTLIINFDRFCDTIYARSHLNYPNRGTGMLEDLAKAQPVYSTGAASAAAGPVPRRSARKRTATSASSPSSASTAGK